MEKEKLLHLIWRHKMLPLASLVTTDGEPLEVIDAGMYNRSDAGPDFFNAKVRINGTLWVGNVELHVRASDWYRHRHDADSAYDNVILHVVETADMSVENARGESIPTLVLPVPPRLCDSYQELLMADKYPPCHSVIPTIPRLKVHAWLNALQTERLLQKTEAITERAKTLGGSWDGAYFATLARSFGFGINGDAFETWAMTNPTDAAGHHRDDLFQVEALFVGQAGLLPRVDERYAKEYDYLRKKFGLTPMEPTLWKYLRTRPQNFPHVRLLQLARMYHERRTSLASLLECDSIDEIGRLYDIKGQRLGLLVINTAVPAIFAYGKTHAKEALCERALALLDEVKAEDNNIVRLWADCGLTAENAGDSQALIQLKKQYCDRKDCLRCHFGYDFLTSEFKNAFIHEE